MSLSFKDAAYMLAALEKYIGNKELVGQFIQECVARDIGGKGSRQSWQRMVELLRESQPVSPKEGQ